MAGGFVKLHRSIQHHWVFADDAMFYLFTNLIMRANWKPGKVWMGGSNAPITVERGQLLTGRNSLHRLLYPTHDKHGKKIKRESSPPHPATLWRWLEALAKDGMVSLDVRNQFTIVTVCNYDTYQGMDDTNAQGVRKRRASGAPSVRQPCADGAPAVRTIEEGEEGKEGKEGKEHEEIPPKPPRGRRVADRSYSPEFLRFWSVYPAYRKSGKPKAWEAWQAAILRADPEAIIDAARDYGRSPLGCGQYSAMPATWLNQDRWDDDRGSWRLSAPGAAPIKRQKSPQEIEDSLRYEIVTLGKRAGKSLEQISADLLARGLKP